MEVSAAVSNPSMSPRNGEAKYGGKLFNQSIDAVRPKKADCFPILKRITKLKCVNSEVRSFQVYRKGVPSNGSMAPCRSHHGNHTRLEKINKVIHWELNPKTCNMYVYIHI